jgi:hypothetical protein
MSDQGLESFWINIAAGVVLLAIVAVLKWSHARWSTGNPAYRRFVLAGVGLCWIVLNSAYAYVCRSGTFLFIFLSSAVLVWIVHSELNQFWRIGLVGADRQIASGIDFQKALRLASSSLDFLGIGAGKLTDQRPEFEEAVGRCNRPDRPVRFLLCRPNHPDLGKMALSANKEPALYKKTVHDSLRMIADLRNRRAWNIRVRFYAEVPTFRLMFVDDSICLASYYVLGKGTGAELPQLHVVRLRGSRDVDSLYFAFSSYFDRIWSDAAGEEWDFRQYLE